MSSPSKLRVIQWATGGVGKAAIQCVLNHPQLELVGCWVHSADKNGVDVGRIIGTQDLGVTATTSADEVLALDADCVMYSPLIPNDDEVIAILRSGKNVVTPVGWVYPDPANPRHRAVADAAAESGVTLHGSGSTLGHHGAIPAHGVLVVVGDHARARRGVLRHPHLQRTRRGPPHHGIRRHARGGHPGADGRTARRGFKQSVRMIADHMGFRIDPNIRTIQDVAVATAEIDYDPFPIAVGTVAARRFRWQALVDGEPVITAAVNWLMGEENLDPAWDFGGRGERFEVDITGDPDVSLTFKGLQPETIAEGLIKNPGVVVTANHCINAVPDVCAAEPGIKTYLDLPLFAGRPAPNLAAGRP